MILDWKADFAFADAHEILDAETGEPLPMEPPWSDIFYADDATGVIRHHVRDEQGWPIVDRGKEEVAWRERKRFIRIVPKASLTTVHTAAATTATATAPEPEPTPTSWRDRPALL